MRRCTRSNGSVRFGCCKKEPRVAGLYSQPLFKRLHSMRSAPIDGVIVSTSIQRRIHGCRRETDTV
jgi:hypothetical protein